MDNVYRSMLEELNEETWAKGHLERAELENGRATGRHTRCLVGAFWSAQGINANTMVANGLAPLEDDGKAAYRAADRLPEFGVLAEVISEQFPDRLFGTGVGNQVPGLAYRYHLPVVNFNDHGRTTIEDVRLVVEKAAVRLEEQI